MKILIVDDEESFELTGVMKKIFPDSQIDSAEESNTAIEKIRKNQYSFITMDGHLGALSSENGPETIEEIRKFNRLVPIIMLSSDSTWNNFGLKMGANASMKKGSFLRGEEDGFKKLLIDLGIIS